MASEPNHAAATPSSAPSRPDRNEHPTFNDVNKFKFFFLMPSGSLVVRTIVYPAMLIKTRMQAPVTAANPGYSSATAAFREIVRREGPRALFRGYFANALNLLNGPVYVLGLETAQTQLRVWTAEMPERYARPIVFLFSGAFASAAAQTLAVPVDIVSQRIMVDRNAATGGLARPFRMLAEIVRTEGVRGLYRGYGVSLATYVPSSAIFWSAYITLRGGFAMVSEASGLTHEREHWPHHWLDAVSVPLSGALGGVISGAATTPIDVVRTRLQLLVGNERMSMREMIALMLKEDGWRAFTRGSSARIFQMALTMTVIITLYESLKRISMIEETAA